MLKFKSQKLSRILSAIKVFFENKLKMEMSEPNQDSKKHANDFKFDKQQAIMQGQFPLQSEATQNQTKKEKIEAKKKWKQQISVQVQIQPLPEYSSQQIERQQDQCIKQYKKKVKQQQKNAENSFSFLEKFKTDQMFEKQQPIFDNKPQLTTFSLGYQSRNRTGKNNKMKGKPIKIPQFSFKKQQVQPPKIQGRQGMLQVDQTMQKMEIFLPQEKQSKKRFKNQDQKQQQQQCIIIQPPIQIKTKKEQTITKDQPVTKKQRKQSDKYYLPSRPKPVEKSGQKTAAFAQDVSTTIRMFEILYERGYTVCRHPDEEYDLLIIGKKLKPSQKLLMAIMLNKKVRSERWLWNPAFKMNEDICGYSWSRVEKAFGSAGKVFGQDGKKYYISPQLRLEYAPLVIIGGGTVYNEVNIGKKSSEMVLVITKKDRDFYMHWRNSKKWKFVSHHMIVISILLGEQVLDKYVVDDKYFLDYQYLK